MRGSNNQEGIIPIISFNKITLYVPLIMMLTCIINFIICNNQGTCKPWPHSTITQCSTMYPNNVLARYFLLIPSIALLMIFTCITGFLKFYSNKLRNPIKIPSFINFAAYLGFPFFVLAISTLDQGKINYDLHEVSAKIFFIAYDLAIWVIFFTYLKIYLKNPLITSPISIGIKGLCCLYQWYFMVDLIIRLLQPIDPSEKSTDKIEVQVEWGLMFTLLIFLGSWYYEFQKVTLSLDENFTFQFNQIDESIQQLELQQEQLKQKLQQQYIFKYQKNNINLNQQYTQQQ